MNPSKNHLSRAIGSTPGQLISKWLKRILAATTVGVIIWSFIWVGMRPVRIAESLDDRTEITVMHWGSRDTDQIYQRLVESFEQKNPFIKIKRINVPTFYIPKIQTQYVANDPPDVMLLLHQNAISFAGKGLLMPLDSFFVEDERSGAAEFQLDDFYPEVLDGFRFDGTVSGQGPLYGLPSGFTTVGFYYNKDLFDRGGSHTRVMTGLGRNLRKKQERSAN